MTRSARAEADAKAVRTLELVRRDAHAAAKAGMLRDYGLAYVPLWLTGLINTLADDYDRIYALRDEERVQPLREKVPSGTYRGPEPERVDVEADTTPGATARPRAQPPPLPVKAKR